MGEVDVSSEGSRTGLGPGTLVGVRRRLTWWQQVLVLYLVARVPTTLLALVAARRQGPWPSRGWDAGAPPLDAYLGNAWDGYWYRAIAMGGYPSQLPIAADGSVAQNAWAFFPLYPLTVRGVMAVTRLPWDLAAPLTSLALGAGACLVIFRLVASLDLNDRPTLPLRTVALVSVFPASLVLQAGYGEALALLLLATALYAIRRRAYLWAIAPTVALGFTRAVALPLACVVVWHGIQRWRAARGAGGAPAPGQRWPLRLAALGVATLVAGFAWPVIAAVATGRADAYFATQSAWRAGAATTTPFAAAAEDLRSNFHAAWPIVAVVGIAALCLLVVSRYGRDLGPEMQAWLAAYPLFLLAAVGATSSVVRFAILAFPLLVILARWARRPAAFGGVVLVFLLAQAFWVLTFWQWEPAPRFTP